MSITSGLAFDMEINDIIGEVEDENPNDITTFMSFEEIVESNFYAPNEMDIKEKEEVS